MEVILTITTNRETIQIYTTNRVAYSNSQNQSDDLKWPLEFDLDVSLKFHQCCNTIQRKKYVCYEVDFPHLSPQYARKLSHWTTYPQLS